MTGGASGMPGERRGAEGDAMQAGAVRAGAMSVDVEEAFHAAALSGVAPRAAWDAMESRVVPATERILALFETAGARATFFVLGCVAARHPRLVRRIAEAGHEVASHGWDHHRIGEQAPQVFRDDVARAKAALEDAAGAAVLGYRAANFSMSAGTWWAYDALAETGHRYSSSVNPVRHDHYGLPEAPRRPFGTDAGIVELPMTTIERGGRRWPVSGGGWFRLLPYPVFRAGLARAAQDGEPPVFYFHPWEADPGQPRLPAPPVARFRHYVNLGAMEGKLARLLSEFGWDRIDRVFAGPIAGRPEVWRPSAAGLRHAA
jgi:polysaccharide deacetylase family protein (PEP-CTERM system associated)